jgi:glycine/serine hydroxymethyltransferase
MGIDEMNILGNIIVRTLKNRENITELETIRQEIKELCVRFPLYSKN